jgi:hypothetical protein
MRTAYIVQLTIVKPSTHDDVPSFLTGWLMYGEHGHPHGTDNPA